MTPPPEPEAAELLEAAPVALLLVGADGLLRRCNGAARALCGERAVAGAALSSLWRDPAHAADLCGSHPSLLRLPLKLTHERWVEVRTQPLAAGGWMLALRPTRGQRARSFVESEEMAARFELATAAAGIGHWVLHQGEERASWSAPLRALFDLSAQAPVPTTDVARASSLGRQTNFGFSPGRFTEESFPI